MKIENAIRKCERAGFRVLEQGGTVTAIRGENEGIRFYSQRTRLHRRFGYHATCFHTFDPRTGSGQVFGWPSLTSIIKSYGGRKS